MAGGGYTDTDISKIQRELIALFESDVEAEDNLDNKFLMLDPCYYMFIIGDSATSLIQKLTNKVRKNVFKNIIRILFGDYSSIHSDNSEKLNDICRDLSNEDKIVVVQLLGDNLPEVNYPQELKDVRERIKIGDRPAEKTPTPEHTDIPSAFREDQDSPGAQQCRTLEDAIRRRINKKDPIILDQSTLQALYNCREMNN